VSKILPTAFCTTETGFFCSTFCPPGSKLAAEPQIHKKLSKKCEIMLEFEKKLFYNGR
jgi:hypothetical protein